MIETFHERMKEMKLTFAEVAKRSGVPLTTLYDSLRLKRDLRLEIAVRIAKCLGITEDEFGKMSYEYYSESPPKLSTITRNMVFRAASKIATESPGIDDWVPVDPRWSSSIVRAGWPIRRSNGVTIAPQSWLKRLGETLEISFSELTFKKAKTKIK